MRTNIDISRDAGRQQLGLVFGFCALVLVGTVFTQTQRSLLPYGGLPSAFSAVPGSTGSAGNRPGTLDIVSFTPTLLRSIRQLIPHAATGSHPFEPPYTGVASRADERGALAPDPALPPAGIDGIGAGPDNVDSNSAPTPPGGLPNDFVNPLPGFPGTAPDDVVPGDGSTPGGGTPPTTGTTPGGGPTTGAVPEPATWGMLIAGFFAIGGAMRRHRRAIRVASVS